MAYMNGNQIYFGVEYNGNPYSDQFVSKNVVESINIYDGQYSSGIIDSGAFIASSSYTCTKYIPVTHDEYFVYKARVALFSTNATKIYLYDESKNYIDNIIATCLDSTNNIYRFKVTTATYTNARYYRVNMGSQNTPPIFMIVKGTTAADYPSEYVPYVNDYYKFEEDIKFSDSMHEEVQNIVVSCDNNHLYGKKLAVNGDSIMYGADYIGGFAKIIGDNNNMIVSNIAVSGGTLANISNRHCIANTVVNMPADYDYYIFDGGVNDASGLSTLGTITNGYNDNFDDTTTIGALEKLCKTVQLTYKGKKYGFIFVHDVFDWNSTWNTTWKPLMKSALIKWGIPYLDLGECVAQLRNLDGLRMYTYNNDGWHPTENGYRLFYVSKIESWLKTL